MRFDQTTDPAHANNRTFPPTQAPLRVFVFGSKADPISEVETYISPPPHSLIVESTSIESSHSYSITDHSVHGLPAAFGSASSVVLPDWFLSTPTRMKN
jgi:hypothetical protein